MKRATPGDLQVSVERRRVDSREAALVRAEGEIDLANADNLSGALLSDACAGCELIVLDLTAVPFMDSSGLRVLLIAARDLGSRLRAVLSPGSPVIRLFELAEVSDRIATFPTERDALAAATPSEPDPHV